MPWTSCGCAERVLYHIVECSAGEINIQIAVSVGFGSETLVIGDESFPHRIVRPRIQHGPVLDRIRLLILFTHETNVRGMIINIVDARIVLGKNFSTGHIMLQYIMELSLGDSANAKQPARALPAAALGFVRQDGGFFRNVEQHPTAL